MKMHPYKLAGMILKTFMSTKLGQLFYDEKSEVLIIKFSNDYYKHSSTSFRILNRVVLKVTILTALVQKALVLNKMLKIESGNFNFLKIEWCCSTT